jgi:hypothetical protein
MSQIATLHLIPESSTATIRAAAEPQKAGWFGKTTDAFWATVQATAPDVLNLDASGYALIVLTEFLREERGFDFTAVDDHPLAQFLSDARSSYFAVFEPTVASAFSVKLSSANLTESELASFANEFSGGDDPNAGKLLLTAAQSLQSARQQVRPGTIGLLHVG